MERTEGGLYVPEDPGQEHRLRIVAGVRLTQRLINDAGLSLITQGPLIQALAPEVFRQVMHFGLAEKA